MLMWTRSALLLVDSFAAAHHLPFAHLAHYGRANDELEMDPRAQSPLFEPEKQSQVIPFSAADWSKILTTSFRAVAVAQNLFYFHSKMLAQANDDVSSRLACHPKDKAGMLSGVWDREELELDEAASLIPEAEARRCVRCAFCRYSPPADAHPEALISLEPLHAGARRSVTTRLPSIYLVPPYSRWHPRRLRSAPFTPSPPHICEHGG
ncbi:hypothetical protein EVG20_g4845 [Dentipellis fragilis]|uniref:Uncharacterized protein n=1 Tax=Dentipellis fragilis TaxID=205917 RepID=A0A4Y9YWX5_9AGAM|nr:hypothetical protein EVG20_g4845 [Dentipellis fragilis]